MAEVSSADLIALLAAADAVAAAAAESGDDDGDDISVDGRTLDLGGDDCDVRYPINATVIEGGDCWKMPDFWKEFSYPNRAAALADARVMLQIVRSSLATLPPGTRFVIPPVPARPA
ncbi:MAG: hypothetical protein R3D98_05010 [Candidatus Krumholzibacteriia bacterium]